MDTRILNRRALVTIAVALAAGTASAAGVGYAQGNGAGPGTATASSNAPGGILAGVQTMLGRLVSQGTISQQQADAVQQQADAGSIDPKSLVQSGAISDAQMRVVAHGIDQLKQAAG